MSISRTLRRTWLILFLYIVIVELAPIGNRSNNDGGGGPPTKRIKSGGPRCELFLSELQLGFLNSNQEKLPFIELQSSCKRKPGPIPNNVFRGYKLIILESEPLSLVTFIDLQHFPFDDRKPFIVIGSPMVPNLDISMSSPHVQSVFSRIQDERMLPIPNEKSYAVLLLGEVTRSEARELNLWITPDGMFQKRILMTEQIRIIQDKLVDMIVLGPESDQLVSAFSSFWKTFNPTNGRMFSPNWNSFEISPPEMSWNVCEKEYKGFNAEMFLLSTESPGLQNSCPPPEDEVNIEDIADIDTAMPDLRPTITDTKMYHTLLEEDYHTIQLHKFNNEKGLQCQEFFPQGERILDKDSIQRWLLFEEQGSCKFSCIACRKYLGTGFRPDFKHKTHIMTKGFFSNNIYDNSDQLKEHEKSTLHQEAMSFFQSVKDSNTYEEAQGTLRASEENEKCLYNATMNFLVLAYTEIRSGASFHFHDAIFRTLRLIGAKVGWLHHTVRGAHDIAMSISGSFKRKFLQYLVDNKVPFSILVDASTTFSQPYLSVYIQTIENNKPVTYFYALIYLEKGEKGKAMADALQKQVEEDTLIVPSFIDHFKNSIVTIVSDGAANMVGVNNSFRTHLMKFVGRILPNVECLNHKLDNAFKMGVKRNRDLTEKLDTRTQQGQAKLWQLTYFEDFEQSINTFYTYFSSRGHKRWLHFLDTAAELGLIPWRLKYVFAIRWSDSHYRAIETIHHNYYAMVEDLAQTQVDKTFDQATQIKAMKLYQRMVDKTFMLVLHEFMDLLNVFKIASKQFQEASSIIVGTAPIVNTVFRSLEGLKENTGNWVNDFLAGCVCSAKCDEGDCTLKLYDECPQVLLNNVKLANNYPTALYYSYVRQTLYENMILALKRYFNLEVLESFELFNPSRLNFDIDSTAHSEPGTLDDFYKENLENPQHQKKLSIQDMIQLVCKFYNVDDLQCTQLGIDWQPLLACIASSSEIADSVKSDASVFWPLALTICTDSWTPITQKLVKFVLVTPFSSSEVERGFSIMNNIKTKARSGMDKRTLDGLMRVKINGPDVEELDSYGYTIDYMKRFARVDDNGMRQSSDDRPRNGKAGGIL